MLRSKGFTIIELMVTIAVLAILITIALPSFESMIEKKRIIGAAESIYSDLQLARSESVKRSSGVLLTVTTTGSGSCAGWSVTVTEGSDQLATTCGDAFPSITMKVNDFTKTFDGMRGTVGSGDTVTLTSEKGLEIRVVLSRFGRVRSCSPVGVNHVGGYPIC